eukprot:1268804-Rhodomonas_salina.1
MEEEHVSVASSEREREKDRERETETERPREKLLGGRRLSAVRRPSVTICGGYWPTPSVLQSPTLKAL